MKWIRSRRAAAAMIAVSVVALSGCGGGGDSANDPGEGTPQAGGSAVFALEEESPGYVPGMSGSIAYSGGMVFQALYDSLTAYTDSGEVVPNLAESIESDKDFTLWTLKIPNNIKYSTGGNVTAQDLASLFKEYYVAEASSSRSTFSSIESVTAPDATTLQFKTKNPYASFPAVLTQYYAFNPNLREKYGDDFAAHPDGTGPFRLVKWQRGSQLELEANPYYWRKDEQGRQLPFLKNVTLRIIPSGPTRTATLESGGIDGFQSVQPGLLQQATSLQDATVLSTSFGGFGWFMNTQNAPTDDIRIRQALAAGTDRAAIVAAQGADEIVKAIDQYYPKTNPYFSQSASDASPKYDATAAEKLVEEYANDPSRSDGKAVGEPVTVQVNYVAGDEQSTSAVQIAEQQWSKVGFKVNPNALDSTAWVQAALQGTTQVFWFGWTNTDPAYNYTRTYSDPAVSPTNWTKLDDKVLQGLIADLRKCPDLKCRQDSNSAIANRMVEVQPVIPLMAVSNGFVYDKTKVGGVSFMRGAEAGFVGGIDWATIWAK